LLHEASVTDASVNATVTAIIEASFGFTVLSLVGRPGLARRNVHDEPNWQRNSA
jgi:hypothetical protein